VVASPLVLPIGYMHAAYSQTFSLTQGTSPATYTFSGTLPAGLTLTSAGVLSGTPTQRGTFPITLGVTDGVGCTTTQSYSLGISKAAAFVVSQGAGGSPVARTFALFDPSPLNTFQVYTPGFSGGISVGMADFTLDGVNDVVTGAGPGAGPHVIVTDGANSRQLLSFLAFDPSISAGVGVAAGDVSGDGFPDVIAATGSGGSPVVRVFDGRDFSIIRQIQPLGAAHTGGFHVAAGDVNGDGWCDIIVGRASGAPGTVHVYDGRTSALLHQFTPYDPSFVGGVFVAGGDVTGDGFADIVTGAGAGGGPIVRVVDGVTGNSVSGALGGFYAYTPTFSGGVRVAASDLNFDRVADVIVGPGAGSGPQVKVFSGATSAELSAFSAFDGAFSGGVFVAGVTPTPRLSIDLPQVGDVTSPFRIRGWAAEETAIVESGVDAIHAWAYPVSGGAPIFAGAATSRVARPDVANLLGGQFLMSGFDFPSTALPLGSYYLAIHMRNAQTGLYDAGRLVVITVK
jgi:hypothetical protein